MRCQSPLCPCGIPQAGWVEMKAGESKIAEVEEKLGYPCFVKPANAGSSVGITKAHDRRELEEGIRLAFAHDDKLLVEAMMTGTEVESSGDWESGAGLCAGCGGDCPCGRSFMTMTPSTTTPIPS